MVAGAEGLCGCKKKLSVKFGALVGTSSNRRKAQLLAVRPDLEIAELRGNVPTRINKLRHEEYDAIMLAKAGIVRLGLDMGEFYVEELGPTEFIPAPAQGVLAIQIREVDKELFDVLQHLNHPEVAEALAIERRVLRLFGGGCHLPLGCYCRKEDGRFQVFTSKATDSEKVPDRYFTEASSTEGLPEKVVAKFNADRKFPATVFISRDLSAQSYFRRAIEKNGVQIEARSLIRTVPIITKLDPYILRNVDWIFFTSKNGVEYFFNLQPQLPKKVKFGVMGSGVDSADVGTEFAKIANGSTILFPAAEDPMRSIHQALSAETKMIDLPVYETVLEDDAEASAAEVLIFTSPSNVEAYFANNLLDVGQQVIAIGKSTGKKLDEIGVGYTLPFSPDETGLAEAVFGLSY